MRALDRADVPMIARTRYRLEAERLAAAGATLAVAEELEASLEVLSQLLVRLHIPGNVVETLVDNYRRVLGAPTGRATRGRRRSRSIRCRSEILDAPVSSFRLAAGRVGGRDDAAGARICATARARRCWRSAAAAGTTTSPHGSSRSRRGDDMFLLGDDSDVLLARALLTDGPRARGA